MKSQMFADKCAYEVVTMIKVFVVPNFEILSQFLTSFFKILSFELGFKKIICQPLICGSLELRLHDSLS